MSKHMKPHRLSTPLHEAPSQNTQRGDVNVTSAQALSEDKFHAGALDSACNRTCCGPVWMDSYLTSSQRMHTLVFNSSLVSSVEEEERFKFGNGGLVTSAKCWRVPACVSGTVILIWISVVPVTSLGCLLGRDFLDAIGTALNFANRSLECTFINAGWQRLDQLSAGHFMLPLLPIRWPRLDVGSWRTCGLDKIIGLKLAPSDWLKCRISEGVSGHPGSDAASHEHNLTENGFFASEVATRLHSTNLTEHEHVDLAQKMNASLKQQPIQHPPRRRSPPVCADDLSEHSARAAAFPSGSRAVRLAPTHDLEPWSPRNVAVERRLCHTVGEDLFSGFLDASSGTKKV